MLIGYRSRAETAVGRGENSGNKLVEYQIVRVVKTLGSWHGAAQQFTLGIASLPADVDGAVVLLQAEQLGAIAGAAVVTW